MGIFHFLMGLFALLFGWLFPFYSYDAQPGYPDYSDYSDYYYYDYYDETPTYLEINEPDLAVLSINIESDNPDTYISDLYGVHVGMSRTVGLLGGPVEVQNVDRYNPAFLTFEYDESKLTCEEADLLVMYYNEEQGFYEELTDCKINSEKNTISVRITKEGGYVLEDGAIWEAVWNGTYDGYEKPKEPECDWHEEFDSEDIEALADISIYDESGEYHITTINELAGLVKLVNEGRSFDGCVFYLENDLDLAGYDWAPIGWVKPANDGYDSKIFAFSGTFYGNGHVIYNLSINAPTHSDIGFFGKILPPFSVHDLGVINCNIVGKHYVGAIVGDFISKGEDYDITGCFATGSVQGGRMTGALVGSSAYLKMKDCYAYMDPEITDVIAGDLTEDLRDVELDNCHMNDKASQTFLRAYLDEE